jgi:hypothetical protein
MIRVFVPVAIMWARPSAVLLEHFQAKWMPVRVKKMRQNKNIESCSDSIGTDKAVARISLGRNHPSDKNTHRFNTLEHVLIGKVDPLFRDML